MQINRYTLEINPNLESIRDEPVFKAMLVEIRADMTDQFARIREMDPTAQICVSH